MNELKKQKLEDYREVINLQIIKIEYKLKNLDSEWAGYHEEDGEIDMENSLAITSKRAILDTKLRDLLWFRNILKELN
jgi:hypothetical protein